MTRQQKLKMAGRRPSAGPREDFWHRVRVGALGAGVLALVYGLVWIF